MIISGTIDSQESPLNGSKGVVVIDDATLVADVTDYDNNPLATLQLTQQPFPHRLGTYIRTADALILVRECNGCDE